MNVVIYGAGGLGREVYDTLLSINSISNIFNIHGFIDDSKTRGEYVNGLAVIGDDSALSKLRGEVGIVIAIASPSSRKAVHMRYRDHFLFPTIVHPSAIVSSFAKVGEAVLIQGGSIVAANSSIGEGVMINAHSGVGHDARVGEYCSIMSYCDVAGGSRLGNLVFMGTGAKVIPNKEVASESYLCAGAVVFKDVLEKSKLLGNPAKIVA